LINDPSMYGLLGGVPETVTIQRLALDPNENGGPEKTNDLARDLRRRIIEGDDMDELVRRYGKYKDDILKDVTITGLSRLYPTVARFADKAQVDDISEPIPLHTKDGSLVMILRLVEKKPGVKPELTSPGVQQTMNKGMMAETDDYRLRRAFQTLFETSFVWPKEHSQPEVK
jgi:hypothetical protein